ncbi:stimulator of interferon genes protein isoform X2 [Trichomycterus rosablanca]|uniref:stimulator of interferon genes protein isoform X2 n=1 Tax=Trichomycterus rosablanca TaxID=2290929 RepID=UPI002F35FA6D
MFLRKHFCTQEQRTSDEYGQSIQRMLQACFSKATLLGFGVVVLVLLVNGAEYTHEKTVLTMLTCAFYLLFKSFGVLGPTPVEVLETCESKQLNVAHGLAWSFYLGYLKLVLPELENQVKKHYNVNGEMLSSYRLHILLPLNAAVRSKLEEEDKNVCFLDNLPELMIDRAGVRKRVYKHSIYKIIDPNKEPYYCIAEFATPLVTLYQMSEDSNVGFGEKDRRQQVLLFYRTLSQILESSLECRNCYRLILLDDEQADDPHYLSKELIKHLQQEDREILMDLPQELGRPVLEHGVFEAPVQNYQQEELSSTSYNLMISQPQSLRSEPVENTDYTNFHNRQR